MLLTRSGRWVTPETEPPWEFCSAANLMMPIPEKDALLQGLIFLLLRDLQLLMMAKGLVL